jgi:hypothetical protein
MLKCCAIEEKKFQNAQIKLTNTETFCVNSKVYFFEVSFSVGIGKREFLIEMVKLFERQILKYVKKCECRENPTRCDRKLY